MLRLIFFGILSAALFSSTFILNRLMSVAGGHWFWTASLRFAYVLVFLIAFIVMTKGFRRLQEIARVFVEYRYFWITAGSVGFGIFYSLLCFSASYAPGWVIATTWQVTILATPIVLVAFGRKVPMKGLLFTGLIFTGIILVNVDYAKSAEAREVILGAIPVLIAAFAYPIGNQMVWEATQKGYWLIPRIDDRVMEDPFARILLLTVGSIPFWLALFLFVSPANPSPGQLLNTALIALLSGVLATALFLQARHLCTRPFEIAAVDATQSMEVIFSLAGEIVLLGGALPGPVGAGGIVIALVGLVAYTRQSYAA